MVLIGVLKGATIFLADLAREIKLDASFDFIAVSSYGNSKQQSGEVKLMKDVDHSMAGKNIILVEDILDTGLTLTYLKNILLGHQPKIAEDRRACSTRSRVDPADTGRLRWIRDSRRVRGGLWAGLRRALP